MNDFESCNMGKLEESDLLLKIKIATRIKFLREQTGMNITEFAKTHFKDKQAQHRLENEGGSIYSIDKFCKEIGINLRQFWDDDHFGKKAD